MLHFYALGCYVDIKKYEHSFAKGFWNILNIKKMVKLVYIILIKVTYNYISYLRDYNK